MGDIGIDKWNEMMEEHKKRGHQIIKYPKKKKLQFQTKDFVIIYR